MKNTFKKFSKDLKKIAKHNRNIKYSEGMLIAFLLMGFRGMAEGIEDGKKIIDNLLDRKNQDQTLSSNPEEMKAIENNLKTSKMELIQPEEEGNYILNLLRTSWQFGLNTFENGWSNQYRDVLEISPENKFENNGIYFKVLENGKEGKIEEENLLSEYSIENIEKVNEVPKIKFGIEMNSDIDGKTNKIENLQNQKIESPKILKETSIVMGNIEKKKAGSETSNYKIELSEIKEENNKSLQNSTIELTQLIEQGNHVVKSPWSSWQIGINTFVNDWNGAHKGYGDETKNIIYKRENKFSVNGNGSKYGTTNIKGITEPVATVPLEIGMGLKDIKKEAFLIDSPKLTSPTKPNLGITVQTPPTVTTVEPTPPKISVALPTPNADPFVDFSFDSAGSSYRYDASIDAGGAHYFAGWENGAPVKYDDLTKAGNTARNSSRIYLTYQIPGSTGFHYKNATIDAAGNLGTNGNTLDGNEGQQIIHTVWDGTLENITGNLYGKTAFIAIETWHGGKLTLKNVKANLYGNDNTIFYIYPTDYHLITNTGYYAHKQRGGFTGDISADIKTNRNNVYLVMGASGSFETKNTGTYKLEGAQNIVYSGLGYSADYSKFDGTGTIVAKTDAEWKPSIQLITPVQSYGDSNIVLFFSDRMEQSAVDKQAIYMSNTQSWQKTAIGLYQGEIEVNAAVGDQLAIDPTATTQTTAGNTVENDKYVEQNVGIYAKSGQRVGITPSADLGAEKTKTNGADYDADLIHNLQINKMNMAFGKYSKDGVMVVAENGTAVNVVMNANPQTIVTQQTGSILDYNSSKTAGPIASADDTVNEAATGTIIALAKGKWGDSTLNSQSFSANTAAALKDKGSEINIGKDVVLSARYANIGGKDSYPIAYAAQSGGIVNAYGNTTATGYGSIIGYASDGGTVNAYGSVEAKDVSAASDAATKAMLYKNIGGYATGLGSTVSLGTNATTTYTSDDMDGTAKITSSYTINPTTSTIHGTGAIAEDNGVVNLNGVTNIEAGTSGALVALTGGTVNYAGGTINNQDRSAITGATSNTRTNLTPFYVDSTTGTSKINITGATTLNIADGVLRNGDAEDYVATDYANATAAEKSVGNYFGMGNVDVRITGNGVNLGIIKGANSIWDGTSATYLGSINNGVTKFKSLTNTGGYAYKSSLVNGTLNITSPLTSINLNDTTDQFNNIIMESELVTIDSGVTITGTDKGLAMGSNNNAVDNTTSGYINKGDVSATAATASEVTAIAVNYGKIDNQGTVTVNKGAGLHGTNGSKLLNSGTINVTTSGVGIVGLGTGDIKQPYGTDILTAATLGTTKTVEINNSGVINVAGDKAIGIYAKNNTGAPQSNVLVENSAALTVGNEGVGIALISTAPTTVSHGTTAEGGVIKVTSTGGTDITTGLKGIGIYAENSTIDLNGAANYVIETKDEGVGIYASGNTTVTNGTLEYKYTGATTAPGIGIVYDSAPTTNSVDVILNNAAGTTSGMVGIYNTATTGTFTNTGNITGTSTEKEFGIVTNGADVVNNGNITLGDATLQTSANVGIYSNSQTPNTITNSGDITVGDNGVGIHGYKVEHNAGTITAGDNGIGISGHKVNHNTGTIIAEDNGIGIYTLGTGTGSLGVINDVTVNSTIVVGNKEAVGVYAVGTNEVITSTVNSQFKIGDGSFGFVNAGTGNTIKSETYSVDLGNDAVYIYQNDATGTVFNLTDLTSTGNKNYGLYGNGTIENAGTIDFSKGITDTTGTVLEGIGNVGMYSTGGTSHNRGKIIVSSSDTAKRDYGIGMATGYYNETTGAISNEGTIINHGTIEVSKANTMGMYAVGSNSKAINYGNINLTGSDTIGMYLDRGAVGENWGTIKTTASGLSGVKGVYVANGSYIKNYGEINIGASDNKSAGIWSDQLSKDNVKETATGTNPVTGSSQTGKSTPAMVVTAATDEKVFGGVTIKTPPKATPVSVTLNATGEKVEVIEVDTNAPIPTPTEAIITAPSRVTTIDLSNLGVNNIPSSTEVNSIGMYVDTSGVNYTNPINGLNNIVGLSDVTLIFGSEVTKYTDGKAIKIGDNILDPYNTALAGVLTPGVTLNVTSGSLTWLAQPVKSPSTGLLDSVYLVKTPYQDLAGDGDEQTYTFLSQLEQRYGVDSTEKEVFNKLNSLGKAEGHIFAQAVDEMKGHQYSNVQQRINETGNTLDKEFKYLMKEWDNPTKENNKIKLFGMRNEYKTETAGVINYTSNAMGVAYVHEDETLKLGNSSGWYAGLSHNRFKFEDIGRSKENQTMLKAGIFKTMSPSEDHNGSLKWTISGEGFVGINEMTRRFWVVDKTYEAQSNYMSYGIGIKNELVKDVRLSERTSIAPYATLDLEYGRFGTIKEDKGVMELEIKGNDYYSIKPEIGIAFNYNQPIAKRSKLTASLGIGYEIELGQIGNVKNNAKLRGSSTSPEYYVLRGEKEDRIGNVKTDFNLGIQNSRIGFTFNVGYDTKGENFRGGIGLRAIY